MVHSFKVIKIGIPNPRSLRSRCIKGADDSTLVMDSSVPLMQLDLSDLGSLINKQHTLYYPFRSYNE